MEVILQENFPSLGYVGDRVSVKPGYARNYLIPRGVAVEVGSSNARKLKHNVGIINAKKAKLKREAEAMAAKLAEVTVELSMKVSSAGRSFGSITVKDIETQLLAKGWQFDRRQIRLAEPIRTPGEHTVQVKLHAELLAPLKVLVKGELVGPAASETEDGEKAPRKRRAKKADAAAEGEATEATEAPAEVKKEKKKKKAKEAKEQE